MSRTAFAARFKALVGSPLGVLPANCMQHRRAVEQAPEQCDSLFGFQDGSNSPAATCKFPLRDRAPFDGCRVVKVLDEPPRGVTNLHRGGGP